MSWSVEIMVARRGQGGTLFCMPPHSPWAGRAAHRPAAASAFRAYLPLLSLVFARLLRAGTSCPAAWWLRVECKQGSPKATRPAVQPMAQPRVMTMAAKVCKCVFGGGSGRGGLGGMAGCGAGAGRPQAEPAAAASQTGPSPPHAGSPEHSTLSPPTCSTIHQLTPLRPSKRPTATAANTQMWEVDTGILREGAGTWQVGVVPQEMQ